MDSMILKAETPMLNGVIFPREGLEKVVENFNKNNDDIELILKDDVISVIIKESHPTYKMLKENENA